MPNRNIEDDTYTKDYASKASQVGTSAATRQTTDDLRKAEETRLLEAARIQRQSVGASYAEQFQQAQGMMSRQQMAGTTPGLTGGLAQQRTSEISGAQMRGLSQLAGQRGQAMREVDYQALMAPRQAFDFAQQQVGAQRDEQMFNLQMISSRESIAKGGGTDENKIAALMETGLSREDAQRTIDESNEGLWKRILAGGELGGAGDLSTLGGIGAGAGFTAVRPLVQFAAPKLAKKGIGKALLAKAPWVGTAIKAVIGAKLAIPIAVAAVVIGGAFAIRNYNATGNIFKSGK